VVAVIDIGANSIRMALAQIADDGEMDILERTQKLVRLGHDTFLTGRLSQRAMNAAITILRDFSQLIQTYQAERIRAVATSAVREASNSEAFADRVAMAVNLDLEVLDPAEESRLTVSAVRETLPSSLDIGRDHALIVDVGGGSTLLTLLEGGVIVASESYPLGSVRLHERLASTREPMDRAVDLLRTQIGNVVAMVRRSMPLDALTSLVLVGEDAQFAAQQAGTSLPDSAVAFRLAAPAFANLVQACTRVSPEELARNFSLTVAKAQRLIPALLIYHALLDATELDDALVCEVSMQDGLLLDMAREVTGEEDEEFAESVIRSAQTLGEKFRCDRRHAEQVGELAVQLFDELAQDYALTPKHRLILRVAAVLHEVGRFLSNRAHHKHSGYLIANSEVFGLGRSELRLVAQVARYHRRSAPKSSHLEYMTLPREDRIAVSKLASILRVADALDRGHSQQVQNLQIDRRASELIIYVNDVMDLTLERRAMAEKADMFEDTYGLKVRLEEAGGGIPPSPPREESLL
jgi:exopolyphosphatase/guanosine-5'-triphosphate,3'-diphosphate pyrophosphatase